MNIISILKNITGTQLYVVVTLSFQISMKKENMQMWNTLGILDAPGVLGFFQLKNYYLLTKLSTTENIFVSHAKLNLMLKED